MTTHRKTLRMAAPFVETLTASKGPGPRKHREDSMKHVIRTTFARAALVALAMTGPAGVALADVSTDAIISDLTAQGFTRIEIRRGPNQIKVEGIRGTQELEVVYDRATGAILKREVGTADLFDDTRPGVLIRDRDRDFVRIATAGSSASSDDDDDDNGRRGRGNDDDDGNDDRGGRSGSDDDNDDRGGRGGSNDDDDDDDRGGRSGSNDSDDDDDDDNGGDDD